MKLTATDIDFMGKRKKLMRLGPPAMLALMLAVVAFGVWMYFTQPLLANPFEVMRRLGESQIESSTIILMAGMLPVVMLVVFALALAVVSFAWFAFRNERHYLKIIDSLQAADTKIPRQN